MTNVTRLQDYWSSAATEMVRRNRRRDANHDDDEEDVEHRCGWFSYWSTKKCLTHAASDVMLC